MAFTMKTKPHKNCNQTGRQKYPSEQFVKIPYGLLKHPNFRALSGSAVKVLLFMTTKHTGFNNKQIILSYDDMAKALHMSKGTAYQACQDLIYYGFIKIIKEGYFYGRKATEWEITFLLSEGYKPTETGKMQSLDYVKEKRNLKSHR